MTRSFIVSLLLIGLRVTSAVELDPHSSLSTEEVENAGSNWVLPAKFDARKTTSPKVLPEQLLAIGLAVSQLASP